VNSWGLDNTERYLGWLVKLSFFHAFTDSRAIMDPSYVTMCRVEDIKGRDPARGNQPPGMWGVMQRSGEHPLMALAMDQVRIEESQKKWIPFFRYFIGELTSIERRWLREMISSLNASVAAIYTMAEGDRKHFLEHNSTLMTALTRFRGPIERVICAQEPDVSWERVAQERLVVYLALGQMVDADGAAGIAKMLVDDINSYAGRIYNFMMGEDQRPVFLICDEIASFINEPMINILNKGRGAGLHCILIGQTMADLEKCLGDKPGARQVLANLNIKIQLRAGEPEDAELLSKLGGKVNVLTTNRSVNLTPGVGDSGNKNIKGFNASENWARQLKEVEKVPPSAILNTPRGQAFGHMFGQVFYFAQGRFDVPLVDLKTEFHLAEAGTSRAKTKMPVIPPMSIRPGGIFGFLGLSSPRIIAPAKPGDRVDDGMRAKGVDRWLFQPETVEVDIVPERDPFSILYGLRGVADAPGATLTDEQIVQQLGSSTDPEVGMAAPIAPADLRTDSRDFINTIENKPAPATDGPQRATDAGANTPQGGSDNATPFGMDGAEVPTVPQEGQRIRETFGDGDLL
jgi:hypothetical protein